MQSINSFFSWNGMLKCSMGGNRNLAAAPTTSTTTAVTPTPLPVLSYDYGYYCEQSWVDSLNEMLSNPVVNMCANRTAITQLLAQVAWETGNYTYLNSPYDGGTGLIHILPAYWAANAADMDVLWPGNNYAGTMLQMGKNFFQSPVFAWRSVAAWFKLTNRVVPGCGFDLFTQTFDTQSRCIAGFPSDRKALLSVSTSCMASVMNTTVQQAKDAAAVLSA
jgi:hypothetical protein